MQDCDMIIIGSGIGSLCAAGLLARYGKAVIVCESHTIAGGAAHSFRRGKFEFDSGPSLYCALERIIPDIRDRIELELIGTPLTHAHYLRRYQGTYGPAIPPGKGMFPSTHTPHCWIVSRS